MATRKPATSMDGLLDAAVEIVKDAIAADEGAHYQVAYTNYAQAVQMFLRAFKRKRARGGRGVGGEGGGGRSPRPTRRPQDLLARREAGEARRRVCSRPTRRPQDLLVRRGRPGTSTNCGVPTAVASACPSQCPSA
jgi:hypothetical protein